MKLSSFLKLSSGTIHGFWINAHTGETYEVGSEWHKQFVYDNLSIFGLKSPPPSIDFLLADWIRVSSFGTSGMKATIVVDAPSTNNKYLYYVQHALLKYLPNSLHRFYDCR